MSKKKELEKTETVDGAINSNDSITSYRIIKKNR